MNTLSEYIKNLGPLILDNSLKGNPVIEGVSNNSLRVKKNYLFIAIPGSKSDGHKFIDNAIKAGACAIIHSKDLQNHQTGISYIKVSNSYHAYAKAVENFFDFPAKSFRLTGITGTNGKTTTAFIIRQILNEHNHKCGLISTVQYSFGDTLVEADRTTPEPFELQELFAGMRKSSCTDVVMETSSHGLDQNRTGSAEFQVAAFTNLTGDHLDYHKTMDNYFDAKKILFTKHLAPTGKAVINIDDDYGKMLVNSLPQENVISFGFDEAADCRAKLILETPKETIFELAFTGRAFRMKTNLIGAHNISNISGAFCAASALGITPEQAEESIQGRLAVPGRLEKFIAPNGAVIFVDYAHTDDALFRVLIGLKKLNPRKIITVFGCGGDRDKTKRPRMGKTAASLSDFIIITTDNPRSEDPLAIIDEIKTGIPSGFPCEAQPDRALAIKAAIGQSSDGDIILIAGKGHENYQVFNDRTEHFDDREEVMKAIS